MTSSQDRIAITGIEDERRDGQLFRADVVLHLDLTAAASTDDLDDTVDYSVVAQAVHAVLAGEPQDLIESVAARCLDACLDDPRVSRALVTIHKPDAPLGVPADGVSVTLDRSRP